MIFSYWVLCGLVIIKIMKCMIWMMLVIINKVFNLIRFINLININFIMGFFV